MAGVYVVLRAIAVTEMTGQMPFGLKVRYATPYRALPLPRATCNRCDRWPALDTLIVGLIGKGKQHQLVTGGQIQIPHQ